MPAAAAAAADAANVVVPKRMADWEIEIPLTQLGPNEVGDKQSMYKAIHEAYANSYLEALGVTPKEHLRKAVARGAPLESCEIEATWANDSSVADNLRIIQPLVCKEDATAAATSKVGSREGLQRGYTRYIGVQPPTVPDVATLSQVVGNGGKSNLDTREAAARAREAALGNMKIHDMAASERCNATLTQELETLRQKVRPGITEEVEQSASMLLQWGADGDRELDALKKKFILPFAADKTPYGLPPHSVLVPWQSSELQNNPAIDVLDELVPIVSEPVSATLESIHVEASRFVKEKLPLELLTTRKDPWLFAALRERLTSPEAIRLIGLLAHLLYWTVFNHLHPPQKRLPNSTRQSLTLTIQELWACMVEPIKASVGRRGELLARDGPSGICFVLPVFQLVIKRGMEHTFHQEFKPVFTDPDIGEEVAQKLVDQINVLIMNTFDPDCSYSNFGALDGSSEAIRLWRKLHVLQMKIGLTPAKKMLGREFRTTPMMLLLMNCDGKDPGNPKTRIHLLKSSSDTVLSTIGGTPPRDPHPSRPLSGSGLSGTGNMSIRETPLASAKPHLDEARRATLFRTARRRLASSGLQVVSKAKQ